MVGDSVFLSFEEKQKRTPKNNGYWTGERGNSRFYSYKDSVKKMGAEYVEYINGEPDFRRFSKCTVEIMSMTNDRYPYSEYFKSNFEQAYPEIAKKLGIKESQVKKWLRENHYTIHEASDLKTIYVIPTEIHKTYIHAGGVAEVNEYEHEKYEDELIENAINSDIDLQNF